MEQPIILVSADSHVSAPPEIYTDFIEEKYRKDLKKLSAENAEWLEIMYNSSEMTPEMLDIIDEAHAIRSDGEKGAWDMSRRIQEMDREGVVCEILVTGTQVSTLPFFGLMNRPYSAELRMAGARAHHRWLGSCIQESKGRQYGIAVSGPCHDIANTVKELHWVAQNGFVGVSPPLMVADPTLPPIYNERYEPFWAACAETGLAISIHAGIGKSQGDFQNFFEKLRQESSSQKISAEQRQEIDERDDSPFFIDIQPRRALWQIMLSGAFDRHPDLRLVLTEVRADWVPATLEHLDQLYIKLGAPMKKMPSEYFERHCAITPSSPRPNELALRHKIGIEKFMFGVDYPHPEGTWPNTWDWIRDAFRDVPENEARMILGENAINFFHLDRNALASIAQRVGSPSPSQVLGKEHYVDPRKIAHFHKRARYQDDAEVVDTQMLEKAFVEDVNNFCRAGGQ